MSWFKKTKDWIKSFFKKEEIKSVPEKEPENTLNKVAREKLALGPKELTLPKKVSTKIQQPCEHNYQLKKQIWVRVAARQFELRNEMCCNKCDIEEVQPIS